MYQVSDVRIREHPGSNSSRWTTYEPGISRVGLRFDAVLSERETQEVLALDTPLADFAIRANSTAAKSYRTQTGENSISLPDPVTMAVLLDPKLKLVVEPVCGTYLRKGCSLLSWFSVFVAAIRIITLLSLAERRKPQC
jgi:hypothetical protein